ncbi:MAG: outer membrane beta-barrel protein [Chitinophagaceae bacterium]
MRAYLKTRSTAYQVDFTQPLKGKQKLELGTKAILRSASSDFTSLIKYSNTDNYKLNPSNSNRFNYHRRYTVFMALITFHLKSYLFVLGLEESSQM